MMNATCYVAGAPVTAGEPLVVRNPYDQQVVGIVPVCGLEQTEAALRACLGAAESLTRFQRSRILEESRALLEARREEFARLITSESGLCPVRAS